MNRLKFVMGKCRAVRTLTCCASRHVGDRFVPIIDSTESAVVSIPHRYWPIKTFASVVSTPGELPASVIYHWELEASLLFAHFIQHVVALQFISVIQPPNWV